MRSARSESTGVCDALSLDMLDKMLGPLVVDIRSTCSWNLYAIVLLGSVARGEATWSGKEILSDLDLHIVTRTLCPSLDERLGEVVEKHSRHLRYSHISFATIPRILYRIYKSIEYYEAARSGHILFGPEGVRGEVRIHDPEDIPPWEGIRLLSNRALGLLEAFRTRTNIAYAIAKSYLGIAEAYLVFNKRYAPSYAERHIRILDKHDFGCVHDFMKKYNIAYEYKTNNRRDIGDLTLEDAIADQLDSLDYFLSMITECQGSIEDKYRALRWRFWNPYHSALSFLKRVREGKCDMNALLMEPCISIWINGISMLKRIRTSSSESSYRDIDAILNDWRSMPQFFVVL